MPRRLIPSGFAMKRALKKSFKVAEDTAQEGLDKFTSTWNTKPSWSVTRKTHRLTIKTKDKRVKWIDEGTKSYTIKPKRRRKGGGRLVFKTGGKPKTIPGRSVAVKGSKGTAFVVAKEVHHPGIRPRHALPIITDRAGKAFTRAMTQEIKDAIAKSSTATE